MPVKLNNGKTIEYAYGTSTGRPDKITLHLDTDYVVDWSYKSGATVVEYRYDSWGKLLSTSGSLASTLGKNNPFRYRGYVYTGNLTIDGRRDGLLLPPKQVL